MTQRYITPLLECEGDMANEGYVGTRTHDSHKSAHFMNACGFLFQNGIMQNLEIEMKIDNIQTRSL